MDAAFQKATGSMRIDTYPSNARCSMKLALEPKMLFHESDLKAKMALTLRRASSVLANRWLREDLLYNAEWEETL